MATLLYNYQTPRSISPIVMTNHFNLPLLSRYNKYIGEHFAQFFTFLDYWKHLCLVKAYCYTHILRCLYIWKGNWLFMTITLTCTVCLYC